MRNVLYFIIRRVFVLIAVLFFFFVKRAYSGRRNTEFRRVYLLAVVSPVNALISHYLGNRQITFYT